MNPVMLSVVRQDDMSGAVGGMIAGMFGLFLFLGLAAYVFSSLCFMKIAEKTNTENGWWAWIPILNILLMLNIARKPLWWILLFLIPLVNIVIAIIVLVEICKARGKSPLLVIGFIIPVVNFVVLGYLAFAD